MTSVGLWGTLWYSVHDQKGGILLEVSDEVCEVVRGVLRPWDELTSIREAWQVQSEASSSVGQLPATTAP